MDIVVPLLASSQEFEQTIYALAEVVPAKGASLVTSFTTSFLAMLVSEVGDKTFFLAMIMALRYSPVVVFIGGYGALFAMTLLSVVFGKIATAWISPLFTNIVVTVLFLFFGIKMLIEAKNHVEVEENEQLKEVEEQLHEMETKFIEIHSNKQILNPTPNSPTQQPNRKKPVIPNSYILTQAFTMTFLAEWGDRSQIATIALAASFNVYMVTLGTLLGHFVCSLAAVKIGQWISGRVSEKQVLTAGGVVFLLSGLFTAALVIEHMAETPKH